MTLIQLKYFCSAVRLRSVKQAAEENFVTQPAISIAIRELEKEFGMTLFYRQGNSLILTAEGENFYERAINIITYCDDLEDEMAARDHTRTPLRVGIPPMLSTIFFPSLLDDFNAIHPDIPITLHEFGSVKASSLVQNDELDLALANLEMYNLDKFNVHVISNDEMQYYVSPTHRFANKTSLSFEDLASDKLILLNRDSVLSHQIRSRINALGLKPRIILNSSQIYTICRFLDKGDIGCLLFSSMKEVMKDYIGISLSPSMHTEIGFIWKKGKSISNQMRMFLKFIENKGFVLTEKIEPSIERKTPLTEKRR